jgi:hypothetical protein
MLFCEAKYLFKSKELLATLATKLDFKPFLDALYELGLK